MNPPREQRDFTPRSYRDELPYKRQRLNTRSASPRPFSQSDQRYKRSNDAEPSKLYESRQPPEPRSQPYDSRPQMHDSRSQPHDRSSAYNRPQNSDRPSSDRQGNPYKKRSEFTSEANHSSVPQERRHPMSISSQKKLRCEFPEPVLYEYGFLGSPQRVQRPEKVFKLIDPLSGKQDIDEVLASISSN